MRSSQLYIVSRALPASYTCTSTGIYIPISDTGISQDAAAEYIYMRKFMHLVAGASLTD